MFERVVKFFAEDRVAPTCRAVGGRCAGAARVVADYAGLALFVVRWFVGLGFFHAGAKVFPMAQVEVDARHDDEELWVALIGA